MRERHLERCPNEALTLFLVTVADVKGLSYYGDTSVRARLGWSEGRLGPARRALMEADLIAYEAPLYQVLSLDPAPSASEPISQARRTRATAALAPSHAAAEGEK